MSPKKFIQNLMKFSVPTVVSAFVGLVAIPLITRLYPPKEYGYISLFVSVTAIMASIVALGLNNSAVRFFYEPLDGSTKEQNFNIAIAVTLIIGGILFIITELFDIPVSTYLFSEKNRNAERLLIIYVILTAVYRLQLNYSRLSQHAFNYNIQQVCYIIGSKILFSVAVLYSTKYIYSVAVMVILLMLQVITVGMRDYSFKLSFPNKKACYGLLRFALPYLPNDIAVMLNNFMAKLVLTYFKDYAAVGIISMATNLANVFNIITNAFTVYWSPFMYENYKKEQRMIKKIHNYIVLLSIILICGIFVFQDILYLILGKEYRSSQSVFMLIILMPFQMLICETTSYGIAISKKAYLNLIPALTACISNVTVSILLYPVLGSNAVAYGIAVSATLQLILRTIIGQHYYSSIESWKKTFLGCLLVLFVCWINVFVYKLLVLRIVLTLFIVIIAVIIYRCDLKCLFQYLKVNEI